MATPWEVQETSERKRCVGTQLETGSEGGAPCQRGPELRDPRWGRDSPEGRQPAHAVVWIPLRDCGLLATRGTGTPEGNTRQQQGKGRPERCLSEPDPDEDGGTGFP